MTSLSLNLPNISFQKQIAQDGSASAAAAASAGEGFAAAAAAASVGLASIQESMSRLDEAAGQTKQTEKPQHKEHQRDHHKSEDKQQKPPMKAMLLMMLMMILQMMQKMLGQQNQNQQQAQQPAQPASPQSQPFQNIQQSMPNSSPIGQQPAQQPSYSPQYSAPAAQPQVSYNQPVAQQQVITPQYIANQSVQPQFNIVNQQVIRPQNNAVQNTQPQAIAQPVQQAAAPATSTSAVATSEPEPAQATSAAAANSATPATQTVPTVVEDKSATSSAAAASASAEKTVSFGDSGKGTPISEIPQNELDAVKGDDLNAKDRNGKPKYVVYEGHLYKSNVGGMYKSVVRLPAGKNNLILSHNAKIEEGGKGGYEVTAKASGAASGSAAADENSASSAAAAAASADIDVKEKEGTVSTVTSKEITMSPLILDANGDGKVSAEQGKGVDLNGDGKADGAATNGDKMLSMGDVDGDGEITGKEVFGDKTVDPFTGKEIKAKNGFEALKEVAKSAEKATGIKCVDDEGNVDLQKLKAALEQSGKGSLGTISDDNNKELESLGDAKSVNVNNYEDTKETGDVQHNQKGSYTTTSGEQRKVDDVWFKAS